MMFTRLRRLKASMTKSSLPCGGTLKNFKMRRSTFADAGVRTLLRANPGGRDVSGHECMARSSAPVSGFTAWPDSIVMMGAISMLLKALTSPPGGGPPGFLSSSSPIGKSNDALATKRCRRS